MELTERLAIGLEAEMTMVVGPQDLATRWGSGGVEVLSTPRMIALMEQTAVSAVDHLLPPGYCTVGTRLDIHHTAATPEGCTVAARARLLEISGRRLTFSVTASDPAGAIGEGVHERTIVGLDGFIARAAARLADATTEPK